MPQSLDKQRGLPWEILTALGPGVIGATFFSKDEALALIEEAYKRYTTGKGYVGQGAFTIALELPTEKGKFVVKWVRAQEAVQPQTRGSMGGGGGMKFEVDPSSRAEIAAATRWRDWYTRRGQADPLADIFVPTQAIRAERAGRPGWWIIQPNVPSVLEARETGLIPKHRVYDWNVSDPVAEQVSALGRQIEEHPILGKQHEISEEQLRHSGRRSARTRFSMADVERGGSFQNVAIDPRTRKPILYDLGSLLNMEVRPGAWHRGALPLKARRLPARIGEAIPLPARMPRGGRGGPAALGLALLAGALYDRFGKRLQRS